MMRFVEGDDRKQVALLPECVHDYIEQDNPVRVVDTFVEELDLAELGLNGTKPTLTGRPSGEHGDELACARLQHEAGMKPRAADGSLQYAQL